MTNPNFSVYFALEGVARNSNPLIDEMGIPSASLSNRGFHEVGDCSD